MSDTITKIVWSYQRDNLAERKKKPSRRKRRGRNVWWRIWREYDDSRKCMLQCSPELSALCQASEPTRLKHKSVSSLPMWISNGWLEERWKAIIRFYAFLFTSSSHSKNQSTFPTRLPILIYIYIREWRANGERWMVCPHHLYRRYSLWICQHSHTNTWPIFWVGFVRQILFRWAHIEWDVHSNHSSPFFFAPTIFFLHKPHRDTLFTHSTRFASVENGAWNSSPLIVLHFILWRGFSTMNFSVHVIQSIHWFYISTPLARSNWAKHTLTIERERGRESWALSSSPASIRAL